MRKLKLELDALQVESFRTADHGLTDRGTVHGHNGLWTFGACSNNVQVIESQELSFAFCFPEPSGPSCDTCEGPGCYPNENVDDL